MEKSVKVARLFAHPKGLTFTDFGMELILRREEKGGGVLTILQFFDNSITAICYK